MSCISQTLALQALVTKDTHYSPDPGKRELFEVLYFEEHAFDPADDPLAILIAEEETEA